MKRFITLGLILVTFAFSAGFNAEVWGNYLIFDPDQRENLLCYPVSWLRPGVQLFDHDYRDSSSTYALWEQVLAVDENNNNYAPGISNHIVVKYTPYSFPHRWSAGLEFTNYKGGNSTHRTDAVLHYQHQKGTVEYFHTSNTQKIRLTSSSTEHQIRAHGLNFNYSLTDKLSLQGGININLIDQSDATETRNYDIHREKIALQYHIKNSFYVYGDVNYWYYHNDDVQGSLLLFYPGLRLDKDVIHAKASLRMSVQTIMPIFEIMIDPGFLHLHLFSKTRSERIDLDQEANRYMGVSAGLKHRSQHHDVYADLTYVYDIHDKSGQVVSPEPIYYPGFRTKAEYRFKTRSVDLFVKGNYQRSENPFKGYYHPVASVISGGLDFRSYPAHGKMRLNGGLNAQYIIHDDPDKVTFDPSKLVYTLNGDADLVGDWKFNASLEAIIQSFRITAQVSVPLEYTNNLYYFFTDGVFLSSDFNIGNALYAGLTIEWLWWK